ncbi:YceI family protein [Pedobacter sp. P351]|uniref:YceI family protein n=1 Tax=Pedobacter superstes TaxID=3133441 RepID=UPI00309D1911
MKCRRLLSIFLFSISVAFFACNNAPKGDKVKISDAEHSESIEEGQSYTVDTTISRISFTGYGVGKNHPGNFHLSSGHITISKKQISGGKFSINIKSIELEQEDDMIQKKLKPHLLSGDFFDAEKFGTAQFEITKVKPYKAAKLVFQ